MAEGIQIRLIHQGRTLPSPPYAAGTVRNTSLFIDDIRQESEIRGRAPEAFYVPPVDPNAPAGTTGFVDLTFTSAVAKSFERGDIRSLIEQGEVSAVFVFGAEGRQGVDGSVFIDDTASPYTAQQWQVEFYVDTTDGPVTIILPHGFVNYSKRIKVIDYGGNAAANSITVTAFNQAGPPLIADLIDGGANTQIVTNFGYLEAVYVDPADPDVDQSGSWQFIGDVNVVAPAAPPGAPRYLPTPGLPPGPVAAVSGDLIEADATAGAFQVDLPAAPVAGDVIIIKKVDATANAVTVNGNGANIDGAATAVINLQYASLTLVRGTAQWWIE